LEGFDGARALFADDLRDVAIDADLQMQRTLDRIDEHIESTEPRWAHEPDRARDLHVGPGPAALDLADRGISTIVWATGYRREYPWVHVPVVDGAGELVQRHGVTQVPGLYALGLKFQRRRASHTIGGVGEDAALLARHIAERAPVPARRRGWALTPREA